MENPSQEGRAVTSVRSMEIVVALLFAAVALIVMWDSIRVGIGWAAEGPEAGYFPFYVGAIMLVSSIITLAANIFTRTPDNSSFVDRGQLQLVLKVLLPSIAFVTLVAFIGLYVAAAVFIAFFMGWVGRYGVTKILPVAVLIPLALFFMFEVWFLVPLPKGPVEALFGY